MTSTADAIAAIRGTRSDLADIRTGLKQADAILFGTGGPEATGEDFELLGFRSDQLTVYGLKAIAFGIKKYAKSVVSTLETKIELRGAIETWANALDDAFASSTSGARIAKIAELLPGVGTTFRRANIDRLMKEAADIASDLRHELDQIDTTYAESLATWKKVYSVADTANDALTAISVGVTIYRSQVRAATEAGVSPNLYAASVKSANVGKDDARLEAALTALADRYAATLDPVIGAQAHMQEIFETAAAAAEGVADRFAGLEDLIAEISDLMATIDTLPATVAPFTNVVSAMVAPFDAIFDFLENPPKVFGFPIFPAISRNDIDAILSFLGGISDTVLGLLDPILDPLLGPVQKAVDQVLDKLNPLKGFAAPVDELKARMAEMFDAVDGIEEMFASLTGLAGEFDGIPGMIEAYDSPIGDETRVTFFGGDDDDVVQGRVATGDEGHGLGGAVLSGGRGDDTLNGTEADDLLAGGADDDVLTGFGGKDVIFGQAGNDSLSGGDGDDLITGNGGDDTIFGGADNDDIAGNSGDDVIDAGDGADRVSAGSGKDRVEGGIGDDTLLGGKDDDVLSGGEGNDTLRAGQGDDQLLGGGDDDFLFGGAGADILRGGAGNDILVGGSGADVYQFDGGGDGSDVIRGFEPGSDLIQIEGGSFDALEIRTTKRATFIDYGSDGVIKLAGFDGTLTADDFAF